MMTDKELDELFKEMMKAKPIKGHRPNLIIHNGRKGHPQEAKCVRIVLSVAYWGEFKAGPNGGHMYEVEMLGIVVELNNERQVEELGLSDYVEKYGQDGLRYSRRYIDGQYDKESNETKDIVLETLDTLLDTRGYIIDKERQ